ncbi:MAG: hypothetical protein Q8M19_24545 [Reyranella sp.]|nr:hypothetical protein [Reyranella sp.]
MARRSAAITQTDITRLIKAAIAAGVGKEHIVGVKLDREGVTLLFGKPTTELVKMINEPSTAETPSAADTSWSDVDAA